MPQAAVCVLGMHRSGTSCLAGSLEQAGVFLGEVSQVDPSNAKGHRENTQIIRLHKDLLHANGGSWYDPPRRVYWSDPYRVRRDGLISLYAATPSWGFKDPRTLYTLEGWLEALPGMRLIGIFRHPMAVARSLQTRDGFSIRKSLKIWRLYNERLIEQQVQRKFPVISFDLDDAAFQSKLLALLEELGYDVRDHAVHFFDPKLRHAKPGRDDVADLPRAVRRLYEQLWQIAA